MQNTLVKGLNSGAPDSGTECISATQAIPPPASGGFTVRCSLLSGDSAGYAPCPPEEGGTVRLDRLMRLGYGVLTTADGRSIMSSHAPVDAIRLLERWVPYARQHLHRHPRDSRLISYGLGHAAHWSQQANATAAGAFAALAVSAAADETATGMSRSEMLATALAMIRFWCHTHVSGAARCSDHRRWGHSWISSLCTERILHAVQALEDHLTDEDRAAVARLHASEANWLLDEHPVTCGLRTNNHPESNIWNGNLLYRAALLNPDHPQAEAWREKGLESLVNGISIPADRESHALLDGKPVRDRHRGPNFSADFELFHHGYLNIGYMVICLSNIAMAHFWLKRAGYDAPDCLYHHAADLWEVVKACTFPDGRLCRIGGDTRVRYTYCQDYALPAWRWAADYLGDEDAVKFERGWLAQVEREMAESEDGSFLGGRLRPLTRVSPLYRLRLEGDKAATLSMAALWPDGVREPNRADSSPAGDQPATHTTWHGRESASVLLRTPRHIAAFVWNGAEGPTGLTLPIHSSDWAEWSGSLAGRVAGLGGIQEYDWHPAECRHENNGFFTRGTVTIRDTLFVAEGDRDRSTARIEIAFTARQDGLTVVAQRGIALQRDWLRDVKGLFLQLPNDLFNGHQRTLHTVGGPLVLDGADVPEAQTIELGSWLNVDGEMGVIAVSGGPLLVHRPAERNIGIRPHAHQPFPRVLGKGHLRCEEICQGKCLTENTLFEPEALLFDTVTLLAVGEPPEQTAARAADLQEWDINDLRTRAWKGNFDHDPFRSS